MPFKNGVETWRRNMASKYGAEIWSEKMLQKYGIEICYRKVAFNCHSYTTDWQSANFRWILFKLVILQYQDFERCRHTLNIALAENRVNNIMAQKTILNERFKSAVYNTNIQIVNNLVLVVVVEDVVEVAEGADKGRHSN